MAILKETYMRGVSKTLFMSEEWGGPLSLFCLTHNKEYKLSTKYKLCEGRDGEGLCHNWHANQQSL